MLISKMNLHSLQIRVDALTNEMQELRSQLEDSASLHERELQTSQQTCVDLQSRVDVALKEVNDDGLIREHVPPLTLHSLV